ncbi:dockerin type I repeat protein [Acetivibrio thermocellus AD2]|uniref:Dockerin type I repeat protein n=1 Tax=Acetivibrio thermocellus AD2 TaxID=1138384 RepID=A0AB36TH57_ACETH|nr:RICIN domain-containing protein [Acetivibrio thermocellus]CDG35356.1 Ricin B lectin [Acetivibrio thermocellus BC1]ADU74624.1 Ricin B lectin [Acetivibrio thermocellus DSM 1313]ALX08567.1 Ricin B lectin [Acetivibrio thermocellus AD2]ANV76316.1 Ricin B lectin [Acetivibrio thermocellus DSM 2360]EIC05507.1 Ricin B lectin [Acetivibrio thermocellus YS]
MVKKNVGLRFLSILILMALLIGNVQSFNVAAAEGVIVNGTQFKDTSGNVIHAHGGGMLKHGDYYYWYGEYRDDSNLFLGVSCYRSKDLVNWEYRGEVLSRNSAPELNHCNIERPKVMYNASTGEFVMWMHWENGINYGQARAAVAYSKTPDGKFTYIRSFRPMQDTGVMDHGLPGYMSRDCNVFVDTDGKGYFISAANENMDLHLYELTPDYKNIASLKAKLFVGQQREAPCLIKRNGYYYLITSGCTGWNPNQAKYAYSKDLASGWSQLYNLGNSTTYRSQPTFIIPVQGSSGTSYLYMGDRWAGAWGGKVNDSQYVWLPLNFISDTTLELPYYDSVKIDASSGIISEYIPDTTRYKLVNKNSGKVLDVLDGSVDNAAQIVQWTDNGSLSQQWYLVDVGGGYKKIVNVKSGRALDVKDESKEDGGVLIQYTSNGGYNQHWKFTDIGDGYYKISSRHCGKLIDVRKWSTEDGGIIQQWSDAGGTNQHWKLVLVSSPEPSPSPSPQVVKGDVNGDLKVNSTDFSMLRRYLLKIIDNFPTENGKQAADLNGDGRINSSDLTMLKRYLLMEVDL